MILIAWARTSSPGDLEGSVERVGETARPRMWYS